jgi:hypothetical protein
LIDNVEFDTKEGKVGDDRQEERKRGRKREARKHTSATLMYERGSQANFTMTCRKA